MMPCEGHTSPRSGKGIPGGKVILLQPKSDSVCNSEYLRLYRGRETMAKLVMVPVLILVFLFLSQVTSKPAED